MLSLINLALAFSSLPNCPEVPEVPSGAACMAMDHGRRLHGIPVPEATANTAFAPAMVTCDAVKAGYEAHCCNASAAVPFDATIVSDAACFVEAGSHVVHAEAFNGAKVEAILSASECVAHHNVWDWQLNPRHPASEFCFVGAFDGLNAMPIKGDGHYQTKETGKTYMRAFINTEIRGKNSPESAEWAISTNPNKGGFTDAGAAQPQPSSSEILTMHGAMEQFVDVDRETFEVVNGGQTVKHVYTARGFPYNTVASATATSDELYTIVTKYSDLHINVLYDSATPREPVCLPSQEGFADADLRYCGLYGHCGSKIAYKHEYSYSVDGAAAYGATSGVGPEDDFVLVAQEGGGDAGPAGTVQILDVARGDWYQLPHLSVGVIEMAFTVSTGHPDYQAIVIEDYGDDSCGSGWTIWVGKKDATSSHFLDRNGLGINQGRLYRFVADSGETDMATFVDWPNSGTDGYAHSDRPGKFEPIEYVFDGRYGEVADDAAYSWTHTSVNCAKTTAGNTPIRMSGVRKQEWGATNPDKPNQFAIAETGIGYSKTANWEGNLGDAKGVPLGGRASTVIFLQWEFLDGLNAMDSTVKSRNGTPLPQSIPAKSYHVMKDQVVLGPDRAAGLSYVDSLYWGKGDNVFFAEDSNAPGGYNIAGVYNVGTGKSVALAGAIGDDNRKMNTVSNFPFGSFSDAKDQELTGWFDATPSLTVSVPYTAQDIYDAQTSKHMILNNQMKGYGHGCMDHGFYYSAQMMYVHVPDFDWATVTAAPVTDTGVGINSFYGFGAGVPARRRQLSEKKELGFLPDADFGNGASDFDVPGSQAH